MERPNCYECKFRGSVPGDAHSSCNHPTNQNELENPMGKTLSIFASVGRMPTIMAPEAAKSLGVTGDPHGIRMGWFNWPYNFDPTWLKTCNGFESKETKLSEQPTSVEAK